MIDYENRIFKIVYDAVRFYNPDIFITTQLSKAPASFPCVSFEQMDSYLSEDKTDSSREQHMVTGVYQICVYSNKASGKRQEAKQIHSIIDDAMTVNGFRRTQLQYQNLVDSTNVDILRLISQYDAEIDADGNIYSRR